MMSGRLSCANGRDSVAIPCVRRFQRLAAGREGRAFCRAVQVGGAEGWCLGDCALIGEGRRIVCRFAGDAARRGRLARCARFLYPRGARAGLFIGQYKSAGQGVICRFAGGAARRGRLAVLDVVFVDRGARTAVFFLLVLSASRRGMGGCFAASLGALRAVVDSPCGLDDFVTARREGRVNFISSSPSGGGSWGARWAACGATVSRCGECRAGMRHRWVS